MSVCNASRFRAVSFNVSPLVRLDVVADMVDELLEGELVHPMEDACLPVDDAVAVRECSARVAVGDAARKLIEHGEAEPDADLPSQVAPSPRQVPAAGCNHRGHDPILVGAAGARHDHLRGVYPPM